MSLSAKLLWWVLMLSGWAGREMDPLSRARLRKCRDMGYTPQEAVAAVAGGDPAELARIDAWGTLPRKGGW